MMQNRNRSTFWTSYTTVSSSRKLYFKYIYIYIQNLWIFRNNKIKPRTSFFMRILKTLFTSWCFHPAFMQYLETNTEVETKPKHREAKTMKKKKKKYKKWPWTTKPVIRVNCWINHLSIDVWFGQYLSEIQLLENLESEDAKKSKY